MDKPDKITKDDNELAHIIVEALKPIIAEKYKEYANKIDRKRTEEVEDIKFNFHTGFLLAMSFILSRFISSSLTPQETLDSVIAIIKSYVKEMKDEKNG
jgi:hypothetical protein